MRLAVFGYVDSVDECARTCVEYRNFSCKSIQIMVHVGARKMHRHCKLLSETAVNGSDKFIDRHSRYSAIYNIQCDSKYYHNIHFVTCIRIHVVIM